MEFIVTVLMPVYNGEEFLREAIESILNQTYPHFKFMIINDGSTDTTAEIVKSYLDNRIIFIENDHNIGIVKTLNRGIDLIDTKYIARMDADDLALPSRLEKQIKFMENNPQIAVVGSAMIVFNDHKEKNYHVLVQPNSLRTQLLFGSPLSHPTTIIRTSVLKNNNIRYNDMDHGAEDYGLWQMLANYNDLANLRDILLKYRDNSTGITSTEEKNIAKRDQVLESIYARVFADLGVSMTEEEQHIYRLFLTGRLHTEVENLVLMGLFLKTVEALNQRQKEYDMKLFVQRLKAYFFYNSQRNNMNLVAIWKMYKKYYRTIFKLNMIDYLKYYVKKVTIYHR